MHTMACYFSWEGMGILTQGATWVSPEGITPSETSQPQEDRHCMTPLIRVPGAVSSIETERSSVDSGGWGTGTGSCLMGTGFQFCKIKKFGDWLHDVNSLNSNEQYTEQW